MFHGAGQQVPQLTGTGQGGRLPNQWKAAVANRFSNVYVLAEGKHQDLSSTSSIDWGIWSSVCKSVCNCPMPLTSVCLVSMAELQ